MLLILINLFACYGIDGGYIMQITAKNRKLLATSIVMRLSLGATGTFTLGQKRPRALPPLPPAARRQMHMGWNPTN